MRIFTDASTSGQVSGIAFIVTDKHHNVLIKKSKPLIESDNNFAELAAILFALEEVSESKEHVTIITDSQYAIGCIKHNRCRKFERPMMDLIQYHLANKRWACFWIKGHKDDGTMLTAFNREADHMANNARKAYIITKRKEKHRKHQQLKRINYKNEGNEYE